MIDQNKPALVLDLFNIWYPQNWGVFNYRLDPSNGTGIHRDSNNVHPIVHLKSHIIHHPSIISRPAAIWEGSWNAPPCWNSRPRRARRTSSRRGGPVRCAWRHSLQSAAWEENQTTWKAERSERWIKMRDEKRILSRRLGMIGICQQSREDMSHGFLVHMMIMIDVLNLGPKSKQTDTIQTWLWHPPLHFNTEPGYATVTR